MLLFVIYAAWSPRSPASKVVLAMIRVREVRKIISNFGTNKINNAFTLRFAQCDVSTARTDNMDFVVFAAEQRAFY